MTSDQLINMSDANTNMGSSALRLKSWLWLLGKQAKQLYYKTGWEGSVAYVQISPLGEN